MAFFKNYSALLSLFSFELSLMIILIINYLIPSFYAYGIIYHYVFIIKLLNLYLNELLLHLLETLSLKILIMDFLNAQELCLLPTKNQGHFLIHLKLYLQN